MQSHKNRFSDIPLEGIAGEHLLRAWNRAGSEFLGHPGRHFWDGREYGTQTLSNPSILNDSERNRHLKDFLSHTIFNIYRQPTEHMLGLWE